MESKCSDAGLYELKVPGYLEKLTNLIETEEPALWNLFSGKEQLAELSESTQLELLKNTVRLDREMHARVYDAASHAADAIGLRVTFIIYQASSLNGGVNAALYFLEDCAHVVLFGSLLKLLNDDELKALLGHELAHHKLWSADEGRYFVADRLLDANACHPSAEPAHIYAYDRFRLCTEMYADRASVIASGSLEPAINCLLKTHTEIEDPDAQAYLRQVAEVFDKSEKGPSSGTTHPELFIRARAMQMWQDDSASCDEEAYKLISGALEIDHLDCLDQRLVEDLTQNMLHLLLHPVFMRSESLIGHARLFCEDISDKWLDRDLEASLNAVLAADSAMDDYWCFLCLDIAAADQEMGDVPLMHTMMVAEKLEIRERLRGHLSKELKLTKKHIDGVWDKRDELLESALQMDVSEEDDSDE